MVINKVQDQTIGALSRVTGVHIETIRYYERIGILQTAARRPSGHRIFGQTHIDRLGFIRRSRKLGFGLEEIRNLLSLDDGGGTLCQDAHKIATDHLSVVEEKITDLQKLAKALGDMAKACKSGSQPKCPIIETLYDQRQL